MTLHLTATTIEEKALKEYLEQTVSEELAEKINNGVPVEKDGKKRISKKTLESFMEYATKEAQKQAAKGATWACLHSDTVFGWAIHYFEEDSILGTLYNEDGTEYTPPKPVRKTTPKSADIPAPTPISKPQPKAGQMSMFDIMDEDDTPVEPVEQESAPEIETMAAPAVSPLYTRYQQYQSEYPDDLIAMKVGDFYEVFGDSAVAAAQALSLTLASRDMGLEERVPMIGLVIAYNCSNSSLRVVLRAIGVSACCGSSALSSLFKGSLVCFISSTDTLSEISDCVSVIFV